MKRRHSLWWILQRNRMTASEKETMIKTFFRAIRGRWRRTGSSGWRSSAVKNKQISIDRRFLLEENDRLTHRTAILWVFPIVKSLSSNCKSRFCLRRKQRMHCVCRSLCWTTYLSSFEIQTSHRMYEAAFSPIHSKRAISSRCGSKSCERTSLTVFFSLSPFWRCCWEDDIGTARLFDEANRETKIESESRDEWHTLCSNVFPMIGGIVIGSMCWQIPLAFCWLDRRNEGDQKHSFVSMNSPLAVIDLPSLFSKRTWRNEYWPNSRFRLSGFHIN